MNIDFIKWMVSYAEGFEDYRPHEEEINFSIKIPLDNIFLQHRYNHFETETWQKIYYPLLLQRAIEGINRDDEIEIIQEAWCIALLKLGKSLPNFEIVGNPDQAKEAALKYIYEQEI